MRRYLGLRLQIVVAFVISAFLLSLLLSLIAYTLTRSNLLDRREDAAITNAVNNANIVNRRLANLRDDEGPEASLQGLITIDRPALIRIAPSYWYSSSGNFDDFSEGELDERLSLLANVRAGEARVMRYRLSDSVARTSPTRAPEAAADESISGETEATSVAEVVVDDAAPTATPEGSTGNPNELILVVSILLPDAPAVTNYIEASSLEDVSETLQSLAVVLAGATALTTLAGAGLGIYVARVTMQPLRDITDAAEQISGGDLSTRLDDEVDPDLASLVHSFNQMTTNLEERIERDARFASDVSHELRSPLMTLTASASVLRGRKEGFDERSRLAIELMTTEIDRFKQLVEDLLEISRFDVGAVALDTSPVLPGEFVRQAIVFAGGDPEVVTVDATSDDLMAEIDKRRMGQVIRNLVENAANYAGGITEVSVSAPNDSSIEIALIDSGPGIPDDEKAQIFNRFFRGAEGGRRGSGTGTGLGLSLVREHVNLHGGSIAVTDRLDRKSGSRFVITLPARPIIEDDPIEWGLA